METRVVKSFSAEGFEDTANSLFNDGWDMVNSGALPGPHTHSIIFWAIFTKGQAPLMDVR